MAWNYTQNILFGLTNSGFVSPVSLFKLDATTATNSFAYDVEFGIEATVIAVIVLAICCLLTFYWGKRIIKSRPISGAFEYLVANDCIMEEDILNPYGLCYD